MSLKLPQIITQFIPYNKKYIKESSIKIILFLSAIVAIVAIFSILFYLFIQAYPAFSKIGILEFIGGLNWKPQLHEIIGVKNAFGALPLIAGSLICTLGAMVIAVPLSIGTAIFISELAPPKVKSFAKPIVELLAGIPSVVYGFFGLIVLVNFFRVSFNVASGEGWFAGAFLLGIMALPTITSVAEDAISSVPTHYKEGSLALGATRWQTISKVILPASLSGITAAIILGIGRAIGETMAVMMVTGNTPLIPLINNPFSTVKTLTGAIAIEMGEAPGGSIWQNSLFGLAFILLIITLIINISSNVILKRLKEKHMAAAASSKKKIFNQGIFEKLKRNMNMIIIAIGLITLFFIFGILITIFIGLFILVFYFVKKRITPKNSQRIAFGLITFSIIIVIFILGIILWDIGSNGVGALSWEFITQGPRDLGRAGGIFPAIVGTFYLAIGAIVIALPIGVLSAIYLTEYTTEGKITKFIRMGADLLNGTPSIVFGLFGFAFLVLTLGWGRCLLAGQVALALMILPTIIRTTEEAIRCVPNSVREGSYALGASKWQTVKRVVLPPALPGILTGSILGLGRAAGETAPIMFTAVIFSSRFLPTDLFKPVMALPYHLYILATTVPNSKTEQYGTALVLIIVVIILYMTAILLRNRYRKKMKW